MLKRTVIFTAIVLLAFTSLASAGDIIIYNYGDPVYANLGNEYKYPLIKARNLQTTKCCKYSLHIWGVKANGEAFDATLSFPEPGETKQIYDETGKPLRCRNYEWELVARDWDGNIVWTSGVRSEARDLLRNKKVSHITLNP